MGTDPQETRIVELLSLQDSGKLSEAEQEELALYDTQEVAAAMQLVATTPDVEEDWAIRVRADHEIRAAESSRFVRIERGVGLGLVAAGYLTAGITLIPGMAILLWSFLRVRLRTHKSDPYSEIEE